MIRTSGVTTTKSRVFRALAAVFTILGGALTKHPSARAQTPEGAVALFMWGLEDGSRLAANKWAVEDDAGRTSAFEIKRFSECRYDVQIQKQLDSLRFDYALDFSSVTEYDAWLANSSSRVIIIKIEGIRWYSKKVVNLKDGRVLQMIKDGSIDANVATGGQSSAYGVPMRISVPITVGAVPSLER